ncbi:hypothetical protein N6H14_17010 [Paenibacillus sp. CC-CFT747]|nr:hypothetical protein N6H14_17010 [Paenibacillus sp. CC-CFT747]
MSRYVASKWRKTEALLPDPAIRDYIPATVKMTRSSLHDMLVRYGTVYIKPDSGLQGKGVMRVERREGRRHKYKYQAGEKIYHFRVYGELYDALRKVIKGRKYLAQKGFRCLLTISVRSTSGSWSRPTWIKSGKRPASSDG